MRHLKLSFIVLTIAAVWWWWPWSEIKQPPGVLAPGAPMQRDFGGKFLGEMKGWRIQGVAEYELRGRVLGSKRYWSGPTADIAPVDVAIGWGRLSDSAVLDKLTITMGNRFFFYEWEDTPPVSESEMEVSMANNHIISGNAEVRSVIRWLRPGHIVVLKGYLVDATQMGVDTWMSSRRRDDTGNGACEIFYVEQAQAYASLADVK